MELVGEPDAEATEVCDVDGVGDSVADAVALIPAVGELLPDGLPVALLDADLGPVEELELLALAVSSAVPVALTDAKFEAEADDEGVGDASAVAVTEDELEKVAKLLAVANDDKEDDDEPRLDADTDAVAEGVGGALEVPLLVADEELEGAPVSVAEADAEPEPALEAVGVPDAPALAEADSEAAAVAEGVGLPEALGYDVREPDPEIEESAELVAKLVPLWLSDGTGVADDELLLLGE